MEVSQSILERWLSEGAELPPRGTRLVGLDELGKALVVSALAARTARPLVVVLPNQSVARNALDHFRFFAGPERASRAHYLPSVDFDFLRGLLPDPELVLERNVALFQALDAPEERVIFTTVRALLQKVLPSEAFLNATQVLKVGEETDRDGLVAALQGAGYQSQPSAYDPGVFAVRGGVIDIFSPVYDRPLRIEFFGDEVHEIRFFDPKTQLSLEKVEKVFLVPVGQTLLPAGEAFSTAAERVKERLDHLGVTKNRREEILQKVLDRQSFAELGLLFPLLSGGSESVASYFGDDALFLWDGRERSLEIARETELRNLHHNHALYEKEPVAIAERDDLFLSEASFGELLEKRADFLFEDFAGTEADWMVLRSEASIRAPGAPAARGATLLAQASSRIKEWVELGYRVNLVCHTQTHEERFRTLIEPYGIACEVHKEGGRPWKEMLGADFQKVHLWQGFIRQGQCYPRLGLVVLSEEEIFGQKKRAARSAHWSGSSDPARLLASFRDLGLNDLVVHKDHGIGRYAGLKSMEVQGVASDFVVIEYKDGDKLYVPVYRLNVLQKYVGAEGGANVAVDKLGGDRWLKAKRKAQKAVAQLAAEFLKMQAQRRLASGHTCSPLGAEYTEFEMEFPYDETPDQQKAIDDVMNDMGQPHPMDRLVCGDVGYGKTEVALRAAYRMVLEKKQVVVLVPTTVLAFQHFETFKKRLSGTGVQVEMVSRLRNHYQIRDTLERVAEGKVDVLIGTHRVLSSDVKFKDLALVIIDEEHRFGVVHKDKLKKLAASVHSLTLTATPIPRTLNMAMSGIKDISVIATPPPDRLSVRTFVSRRTPELIREAIQNELAREGQVFFVHNRIETQPKVAEELRQLFPRVPIEVVHGQMEPDALEEKMLNFFQGEAKILLTTAIIESGLDVPMANTIIIDQADHFGLAQLYQLRGRVGRSERRAYCYLMVHNENLITEDARERLQVLQRYTDLGAGFQVASHDLEIRGSGDLLGKDQHGHLAAIGVDYYFELLDDCMRELRGQAKRVEVEPEINLRVPAFLPEGYVPDLSERIQVYRRLSSVESDDQVADAEEEIRDRFGSLPEEVVNLLGLMRIKLHLKRMHVVRMGVGPKRTSLQFAPTTPVSPERIVWLVQTQPKRYSITPDQKLVILVEDTHWEAQLREIQRLTETLGLTDSVS